MLGFIGSFTLPLLLGRKIISTLSHGSDLYAYIVGLLVIVVAISAVFRIASFFSNFIRIQSQQPFSLLGALRSLFTIIGKFLVVAIFVGCVVPFAMGGVLYFSLIDPLRVSPYQTAIHTPLSYWVQGAAWLYLWYSFARYGFVSKKWKERIDKIADDGIMRISLLYIGREVVAPLLSWSLFRLATPYAFNSLILPSFNPATYFGFDVSSKVIEFYSYAAFAAVLEGIAFVKSSSKRLLQVHREIRDRHYMIGQQLVNAGVDALPRQ
jgi:hypothetical protein